MLSALEVCSHINALYKSTFYYYYYYYYTYSLGNSNGSQCQPVDKLIFSLETRRIIHGISVATVSYFTVKKISVYPRIFCGEFSIF